MGSGIDPIWWIVINTILIVLILPGGFFMFRAFLRRMRREEGLDEQEKQK
ncbi:DUF2621 family protein [Effusibacillus lacus]|nr:DUF2621 family protein [Effusibacillus lacus]TCS74415.1 uncharacterized protein DUF2621 [Effusibacillus lacus]